METPEYSNPFDAATAALASAMGETENPEVQDAPLEEMVDTQAEDTPLEEEDNEKETADPNLEAAQTLLSAIQAGGDAAQQVLLGLAKSAGLAVEFKKNPDAVVQSLKEILTEELGEDNSYLAEKLSVGLEKFLAVRDEKHTTEINALKNRDVETAVMNQVNSATAELARFDDFKTLEARMIELSAKIKPASGVSPEEYLKTLYAASGGKSKLSMAPGTQKIPPQRVASPALDRTPQPQVPAVDRVISSTRQAAELALQQLLSSANKN